MTEIDQMRSKGLDECRLADTGGAGNSNANGRTRARREMLEKLRSENLMIGPRRFDQGHGARERTSIAGKNRLGELLRIEVLVLRRLGHWLTRSGELDDGLIHPEALSGGNQH